MLCKTTKACRKILLDFLPLILATTPTPQASCSNQGSYNPCFLGSEVFIINSLSKHFINKSISSSVSVSVKDHHNDCNFNYNTTLLRSQIIYIYLFTWQKFCKRQFSERSIFYPYTPLHFSNTFFHFSCTLNVFLGIFLFSHLTNREIVAIMWRTQRCVYFNFKNKNAMNGKIYLPQHPERRRMVQAASKQAKKLTREQLLWTK